MADNLTYEEQIQSELFVLRIAVTVALSMLLGQQSDPRKAADELAEMISNSVDAFEIHGLPEPRRSVIKEVMRERALKLVSSAANPGRISRRG